MSLSAAAPSTATVLPSTTPSIFSSALSPAPDVLFSYAYLTLAQNLAKSENPAFDRLERIVALCPRLSPQFNLKELVNGKEVRPTAHINSSVPNHPNPNHLSADHKDEKETSNSRGNLPESEPSVLPAALPSHSLAELYTLLKNDSMNQSFQIQLSSSTFSSLSGHSVFDIRSLTALLSIGHYLVESEIDTLHPHHFATLLPFLLRFAALLPYLQWSQIGDFGSLMTSSPLSPSHPSILSSSSSLSQLSPTFHFTRDFITLFIQIAQKHDQTRAYIISTILHLLRTCTIIFTNELLFKSSSERLLYKNTSDVLCGAVVSLGDFTLPYNIVSACEMARALEVLMVKLESSPSHSFPPYYAFTLRAFVGLLRQVPSAFSSDQYVTLFDKHVVPVGELMPSYGKVTAVFKSSSYSTTLTLIFALQLAVLCSIQNSSLITKTTQRLKELLDRCLNSENENQVSKGTNGMDATNFNNSLVMIGCVEVCDAICTGLVDLTMQYTQDMLGLAIDTCKSILISSRRLASHPKHKYLRASLTRVIRTLLSHELETVSYESSMCRSFISSLVSGLYKQDSLATESSTPESEKALALFQRHLILLLDVLSGIDNEKMLFDALPLIIQRFFNRPRYLHLVVPQLTDVALRSTNSQATDSILSLLIKSYAMKSAPTVDDSKSVEAKTSESMSFQQNWIEIAQSFKRLAQHLADEDRRRTTAKRLIRLFLEIGFIIVSDTRSDPFAQVSICGHLLPALSYLISPNVHQYQLSPAEYLDAATLSDTHASFIGSQLFSSHESNIKWFRRMWMHLVMFSFVLPNQWKQEEWFLAVKRISGNTPALVLSNKKDYLKTQLDLESSRYPVPTEVIAPLRRQLATYLPTVSSIISNLGTAQVLYASAVYHLETLRVKSGSGHGFLPIFLYVGDEGILDSDLYKVMLAIADIVFALHLELVFSQEKSSNSTAMESHVIFLIHKCGSRYAAERNLAMMFLKKLTYRHPHFQWSSTCLTALLNLIQVATQSIDTHEAIVSSVYEDLGIGMKNDDLPSSGACCIDFPEQLFMRMAIQSSLRELALAWLTNAMYLVPEETTSVIQEYIQSVKRGDFSMQATPATTLLTSFQGILPAYHGAEIVHTGIAIALKGTSGRSNDEALSTIVSSLSVKEKFLGGIAGLFAHYQHERGTQSKTKPLQLALDSNEAAVSFGRLISARIFTRCKELLGEFRSLTKTVNPSSSPAEDSPATNLNNNSSLLSFHERFSRLLYHAAALLIWCKHNQHPCDEQDLLHLVCKAPAQIFTAPALTAGVFVWQWILSASKTFELPLMVEMKAAWAHTIDRQIGLFSQLRTQRQRAYSSMHSESSVSPPLPSIVSAPDLVTETHLVDSRVRETSKSNQENRNSIFPPLFEIHPFFDSVTPHVIWTRFLTSHYSHMNAFSHPTAHILASMLHKAFARSDFLSTESSSFGARFRLLTLAFLLVQGNTSLSPRDKELLRDRIFAAGLQWFYSQPSWYDPGSVVCLKEDLSVIVQFCKVLQAEDKFWRESKEGFEKSKSTTKPLDKKPLEISSSDDTSYLFGADGGRYTRLSRSRNLLLFLLCHEIDRILTWHAPYRTSIQEVHASFAVADLNLFTTHRNIQLSEWRSFVSSAWNIDPHLAIRFGQRFFNHETVRNDLCELVRAAPHAVYDLGDAVTFLITESNVKNNIPELQHLLYFAPTSIPVALSYLVPPYSTNRMVVEYTVHSLLSHPVEHVVFYLSQIVQCIRHDEFGLVRRFLLSSCTKSILLSHQLIWLLQAELGEVKPTNKEIEMTPFRVHCLSILNNVKENFTENERAFYDDEFTFFEQITAISGILKPLPTKPERKAKIKEELEKISVKPGLYLPTYPHFQVTSIVTTSGAPMQSAAKVPILVAFRGKNCTLDEEAIREGRRPDNLDQFDQDSQSENQQNNNSIQTTATKKKDPKSPTSPTSPRSHFSFPQTPKSPQSSTTSSPRSSNINATEDIHEKPKKHELVQACIFKVGDDVRQDSLALQIIQWCKDIFSSLALPHYLFPYRVLPNRTGDDNLIGGVIECVPKAQTRDEIGKSFGGSLKQYFLSKYGREEGPQYQRAVRNFIVSCAGYAITSYILQVKDRHNGNLMINEDGHMIHIDFGFIFDISPAKDMRFESAAFKLTTEMVELMGGQTIVQSSTNHVTTKVTTMNNSNTAPLYQWFELLVVRGFLAVREHMHEVIALVQPMLSSTLHCFKPPSLANLKARFFPEKDEQGAAEAMLFLIKDANNKWTTNGYDWIQKKQQNVYYYTGAEND